MNYNAIAQILDQAALEAEAVEQISKQHPMNLQESYAVQSISLARRYIRGEKWVGMKLGFTSKAKMEQMGIHDLIWGRLTDKMQHENGGDLHFDQFIHPRAEPEIAFRIAKEVVEIVTLDNAKDYVDGLAVAIEIIDSRYRNFKFSLEDVIADNCSSTAFTIGEWLPVDTEINHIPMSLLIDGEVVQAGNSEAILGNPWESFVAAARLARENGETLLPGSIILAGAATPAVYLKKGQRVSAEAAGLGTVALQVV